MKRWAGALALMCGLAACGQQAEFDSGGEPPPKVFVCKYVGTPGVDEVLQTGQNPISVSINAIPDGIGVGDEFADAQGRSLVIAFDTGQEEPAPVCPTQTPPTTTLAPPPPPPPQTTTTTIDATTTTVEATTTTVAVTTTTVCAICGPATVVTTTTTAKPPTGTVPASGTTPPGALPPTR